MSYAREMKLDRGWSLCVMDDAQVNGTIVRGAELTGDRISASVPGDWILDYVKQGLLDEPYFGDNYLKLRSYENSHVFYMTKFDWDGEPDALSFLRFEGIDTVADVYLNGEYIGHAENMYIPHEFQAKGLMKGENELLVHILPVCLEARKYPVGAQYSHLKYNYEGLVIRKAVHMFGWDIAPRIVSSGLWRPVSVVQKRPERIENVFIVTEKILPDGSVNCEMSFDIDIGRRPMQGYSLRIEGVCGDSRFEKTESLWYIHGWMRGIRVKNAKLWWPRGYGEANLYDVTVSLLKDGEAVDAVSFRQGLRTTKLVYDDYISGDTEAEFSFVVNDKRIYIKGTNWVPADAFHSKDEERIPAILELVKDIGCNAMRIWGGGVYENDYFYDWCDENGIAIWHDFMMACGVYPHTERMKKQLEEEAAAMVRRLRHHACICLWAGDNECDQSYCWNGKRMDPTRNVLTREVLPAVLLAEDWSRPYLPSSPYVSQKAFSLGQETNTPEQHLWGPRDYYKGPFYHDHRASFASEMGYHGCNSPASIRKFIPGDKLWPQTDNDMWLYHAASPEVEDSPYTYRIPLMTNQIRYLFKQKPDNLEEYARMSQISQAEAKKFFVESFRARKGRRTGLIWWNIMDCWPQFSDAVVDYYFCKKLAYFYIRRSQEPVCLMADDHSGREALYGVSDLMEDMSVRYTVTDVTDGRVIIAAQSMLKADASTFLWDLPETKEPHFYLIEWERADGVMGSNHYMTGKEPVDYAWYMDCLKKAEYDEFEGFDE